MKKILLARFDIHHRLYNNVLDGVFDNTVAGLWAFFNHHQAYHIGQIGIVRRGFGKEAMRYA